ncbi:LLM class flavin-dependent oxidoreductase [Corynebacterium pseudodiphtheriticum]|uniref:LLM class flavin-dependent oxidoreductase n=1 Tax=Corynebacterium pseudodiphtheriticum TaxID=37637 RepID=UPI002540C6CE|nr:LLM class flavin-dependent oxidoreductase [Corynebacterium pseudodiphtheriticum]MDK4240861.1 LLM class flavin-dependent oxidoreductase [Corynebacterium pseudodiphtheriticum]MDK4321767.1 LLM class flavin-dependent oxidoreductase [Corynebacterium pseudodiphtheriticum]
MSKPESASAAANPTTTPGDSARNIPLSLIDFCTMYPGESTAATMRRSVDFARSAEKLGFARIWYAEHHNMPQIASSVPSLIMAHVGAHTETIRLGAGGVMLPNHAPYSIAEQYGTLAEMYPGRIDLGLGRAPGTDMHTLGRALRRDPRAAENFPDDVRQLQGYLGAPEDSPVPGVVAIPGRNTHVPLYILGSSLFGASLAAKYGLPYAFASHFAPQHLENATRYYRENFQPSEYLAEPYVIAAVNVVADETTERAQAQFEEVARKRVQAFAARGAKITDAQLDDLVNSPQGQQIISMLHYTAVGTEDEVRDYLQEFAATASADELMVSLQGPSYEHTAASMQHLANTWKL